MGNDSHAAPKGSESNAPMGAAAEFPLAGLSPEEMEELLAELSQEPVAPPR
jgi:hypothetical protein